MAKLVEISDDLLLEAQRTAEFADRSVGGQIELWAELGRAVEPLIDGSLALALKHAGAATPLSECFASVETEQGRQRLSEYLNSRPFPHYEAARGALGLLVRIDSDGTRTRGRFVGREFQPIP